MDSLPMNTLLEFNKDTLQTIRKDYNLDKPGSMDQAIDILHEWVQKQNHFEIKDYPEAASEAAEFSKWRKHESLRNDYICVPFAVEIIGPWGPRAMKFLKELYPRLVVTAGDKSAGSFLAQRLSIAIQRGNAASALGTIPRGAAREYLERIIIISKGSVERAKSKLDKNCTLRTLMPQFYKFIDFKTEYKYSDIVWDGVLPKMTDDFYRIYSLKNVGKRFDDGDMNYFRLIVAIAEYVTAHDYFRGIIIILDYLETNLIELLKVLDFAKLRQFITLLTDGYGVRIKAFHIITPSKTVEAFVAILKQVLSAKVGQRIQIHKDLESLHKVVQKDVLPVELGGNERSIVELHKEWIDVLSSKEFQEYYGKMKAATTNEKYRQTDKLNEEYMGIAGTFKTLNVD